MIDANKPDEHGWIHSGEPVKPGKDSRMLVTLEQGNMTWVGIRAYHIRDRYWMNGGEPELARVVAWQALPEPTKHFWDRGILQ